MPTKGIRVYAAPKTGGKLTVKNRRGVLKRRSKMIERAKKRAYQSHHISKCGPKGGSGGTVPPFGKKMKG